MVTSTRKQSSKPALTTSRKEKHPAVAPLTQEVTVIKKKSSTAVVPPSPVAQAVDLPTFPDGNLSAADCFRFNDGPKKPLKRAFNFSANGILVQSTKANTKVQDKSSMVRLAIIPNQALIFRIEPRDSSVCSWAEKILMDDVKMQAPWAVDANFDQYVYTWFNDDQKMLNARNYGIRLFAIYVQDTDSITDESLINLGLHIAHELTEHEKNDTVVDVPSAEHYFWSRDSTWQELIGTEAALGHLRFNTTSTFHKGYYEKYTTEIHAHFRPGKFTVELACMLHAPIKTIQHKLLREAAERKVSARRAAIGLKTSNVALAPGFHLPPNDAGTTNRTDVIDLNNNDPSGDEEELDDFIETTD